MTTNTNFINWNCTVEQNLYDEIYEEMIQIHGIDITYVIQNIENEHKILGDIEYSTFETTHTIEGFIESVDGFEGEGDMLQKFGLEIRDQMMFTIHKGRFDSLGLGRPKEGDLIYFPLNKKIFEIRFVEHEKPFYSFGRNYVYTLTLELFEYSNQTFKTGITDIDNLQYENAYSMNMTLGVGSGTYTVGESAYAGVDLNSATAQGTVASWDSGNSILELVDILGTFADGENIIGDSSGASYALSVATTYEDIELEFPNDPTSDNKDFESEAASIIDFSESNPFSESDF